MDNTFLLEEALGYTFRDKDLLQTALTHRSYNYADTGIKNNERLEFLGDAVLQLCVSERLYSIMPHGTEGHMTGVRRSLVAREPLSAAARSISLGQYLRLGPGEKRTGGQNKDSILENAMEAIIGAIYLDGGHIAAAACVYRLLNVDGMTVADDYKTMLQEKIQADGKSVLYRTVDEQGPPHNRVFTAEAYTTEDGALAQGSGRTKKEAEQSAARIALDK